MLGLPQYLFMERLRIMMYIIDEKFEFYEMKFLIRINYNWYIQLIQLQVTNIFNHAVQNNTNIGILSRLSSHLFTYSLCLSSHRILLNKMLPAYRHRCIFDVWEFRFNSLTLKLRRRFLASNKIRPDVRDKKGRGKNICYKTRH